MEIWEIKLWEWHSDNPPGKDILVIAKEYDHTDLEAILQQITEKHPELEALRDGANLIVASNKVLLAIKILAYYSIDLSEHINIEGFTRRNQLSCTF